MKNFIFFVLGAFFVFSVSTTQKNIQTPLEVKKSFSEVEQIQGFYVFTDSKPLRDYKYLGTVKVSFGLSGQYEAVRNKLIKKAREEFKEGNGLILHFATMGTDKADVIKFN